MKAGSYPSFLLDLWLGYRSRSAPPAPLSLTLQEQNYAKRARIAIPPP